MTKAEQLHKDWLDYNKRMKVSRCGTLTFEAYTKMLYGRVGRKIKSFDKVPTYAIPVWATSNDIKSLKTNTSHIAARNSMVEKVIQGLIKGTDAEEIIKKSNRVGLLTSKGGYGYISDNTDPKTLGKKTQEL